MLVQSDKILGDPIILDLNYLLKERLSILSGLRFGVSL